MDLENLFSLQSLFEFEDNATLETLDVIDMKVNAWMGDAILHGFVSKYLWEKTSDDERHECLLSERRSKLVSNRSLSIFLDKCTTISLNYPCNDHTKGTLFEHLLYKCHSESPVKASRALEKYIERMSKQDMADKISAFELYEAIYYFDLKSNVWSFTSGEIVPEDKVPSHILQKQRNNGKDDLPQPLRSYQVRIRDEALNYNSLVVLPTGAGKTRIAAEVADFHLSESSKSVLFLVPTCLLVKQQASNIRISTCRKVAEFTGGVRPPSADFDILVSTPAAFIRLSKCSPSTFGIHCFCLIVFDEVHHVVKQHPYMKIAKLLRAIRDRPRPQVIGLTASLTYALEDSQIKKAIEAMCTELSIERVLTASKDELRDGGYHASDVAPLLASSFSSVADDESIVCVDICGDGCGMPAPLPGQVHEALPDFLRAVESHDTALDPLALAVMDAVRVTEAGIVQMDPSFTSPIGMKRKRSPVAEWGEFANRLSGKCGSPSSALAQAYKVLEHLYEALRLVINSRQADVELAMQYLVMMGVVNPATHSSSSSSSSLSRLTELWIERKSQYRRLSSLRAALLGQRRLLGPNLRCIVFCQQRVTTHILKHFIDTDSDLGDMSSDVIYATSSPATAQLSVTKTQVQSRLQQFANGELSLLFATAVAEEGMDIPASNCVIRFDPVQTPVSFVQSRGRARQEESTFIVMQEQRGRGVAELAAAELRQAKALQSISLGNDTDTDRTASQVACGSAQHNMLLQSAMTKLQEQLTLRSNGAASFIGELALVKQFAKWTQSQYLEQFTHNADGWACCMKLLQPWGAGSDLVATTSAATKDASRRAASSILLSKLST